VMIAADGRRAGTISGGCLEAEVARKAFWHTSDGPAIRHYSTSPEDGEVPFGMGCGGVVHVLLERPETAEPMLERLAAHYADRTPLAVATILDRDGIGERAFWPRSSEEVPDAADSAALQELARQGYEEQSSFSNTIAQDGGEPVPVRVEWNAPRPGLFVFGAGDDAIPLVRLARQMGWYVSVADGRSNLATQARFPEAHEVHALKPGALPSFNLRSADAVVLLTHSLEQDTRILGSLIEEDLAYIGVLGPRRRTAEILATLAEASGLHPSRTEAQVLARLERLYAPMGLDLGGDTPADVAISVIAEIQQSRHRRTGLPLRQVRARSTELKRATA